MQSHLRFLFVLLAFVLGQSMASYEAVHAQATGVDCAEDSGVTAHSGNTLETFVDGTGGVVFDPAGAALTLKRSGGNFTATSFALGDSTVTTAPFLGCIGDANGDGWDDLIGATIGARKIGVWYNRTFENRAGTDTSLWTVADPAACTTFDWADTNCTIEPKFRRDGWITESTATGANVTNGNSITGQITCDDFNLDGRPDFVILFQNGNHNVHTTRPEYLRMFLNQGNDASGNATWSYHDVASQGDFARIGRNSEGVVWSEDVNGDGWPDIIQPGASGSSNRAVARIFINDLGEANNPSTNTSDACPEPRDATVDPANTGCRPKFTPGAELVRESDNLNLGIGGASSVAYFDYNGDGARELLLVGQQDPATRILIFPGISSTSVDFNGRISLPSRRKQGFVLPGDMNLDGIPDLISGDDLGDRRALYYQNKGTSNLTDLFEPFVDLQFTNSAGNTFSDFDAAALVDYDNDPDGTLDLFISNGNEGEYAFVANRVEAEFVACGLVESGIVDLGALTDVEFQISDIRIDVDELVPSGTLITYEITKSDGANPDDWVWVPMGDCADADDSTYCANVANLPGRSIRWRAHLFSQLDAAGNGICTGGPGSVTPRLSGVDISFDYFPDQQHVQAGTVVASDIIYAGTFEELGGRGHLVASNLNGGFLWDAGEVLDGTDFSGGAAQGQTVDNRTIFISAPDASGALSRVPFHWNQATDSDPTYGDGLLRAFGAGTTASRAMLIVEWARSARFGRAGSRSRLGPVFNSTPAVIGPPGDPFWLNFANASVRTAYREFQDDNSTRATIVLFGAGDGMIHAIHTDPGETAPNTANFESSGHEAWAYIPAEIGARMSEDFTNLEVTAFPDGAPTISDVQFADQSVHTVAVIGGGNGSKSYTALDITNTLDPQPLWELQPGGAAAGQAFSRATIARTRINATDRHIVIMATGLDNDNQAPPFDKGRQVVAVDVETGQKLWRFEAACPITSSLTTYEVESDVEGTAIDGFMDRVVFGDLCGQLYKLDVAQDFSSDLVNGEFPVGAGWNDNTAVNPTGTEALEAQGGNSGVKALFSLRDSDWPSDASTQGAVLNGFLEPEALSLVLDASASYGPETIRPITGTIAVREDSTGIPDIFFGTGGREDYDPTLRNAMFAVDSVLGVARDAIAGECRPSLFGGGSEHCEKFYNGITVSSSELIFTVSTDSQGECDLGSSRLVISPLNRICSLLLIGSGSTDQCQKVVNLSATVVSTVFGYGAGVVFGTSNGEVAVVGDIGGDGITAGTGGPGPGGGGIGAYGTEISSSPFREGDTNAGKVRCGANAPPGCGE